MELRDLEAFIAVIEFGGFRAAAEATHLSQSAVSRRVARLEARLGVRLVVRSAPVAATHAGAELHERVAPLVCQLRHALLTVVDHAAGPIHIGYVSPAIIALVPALLDTLRRLAPDATLELHERPSVGVRDGLHSSELTFGFLLEEATDPSLTFLPLARFGYALALPADDPLAGRASVDPAELGERTLLTLARHEPVHARIRAQLAERAPGLRQQDAFGFSEIQHLVSSSLGIAAVPQGLMRTPPPGISVVAVDPPLPSATLGLAATSPLAGRLVRDCFSAMRQRFPDPQ